MINQIIVFVLAVACVSAGVVDFDDCGSTAEVHELRVTGCDAQPCTFIKGQHYVIETEVTARSSSNTLPFQMTGIIVIPIVIIEGDACDSLTIGTCPAMNGERFSAAIHYDVPSTFPQLDTRVRATVRDDNNRVVICGEINVQIRNSARDNLLELLEYIRKSKSQIRLE